ncbi:Uncharacterized protein Fot_03270 [Forsythia ovata]|uniref:Uncharacterized protein n=1 Tax=Forsythia ovata TaxID=205694 RepID=A0ABD1X9U6_9LAMI
MRFQSLSKNAKTCENSPTYNLYGEEIHSRGPASILGPTSISQVLLNSKREVLPNLYKEGHPRTGGLTSISGPTSIFQVLLNHTKEVLPTTSMKRGFAHQEVLLRYLSKLHPLFFYLKDIYLLFNHQPVQDPKITYEPVAGPVNDGNGLQERDQNVNLHKSLSAKLALSHSPAQSKSDSSRASSPKARFSPVRKMFDPFVKAKSQRSLLSSTNKAGRETMIGIKPNKTLCESLPRDFSEMPNDLERNSQCQEKENCSSVSQCSPAHLHGVLKLENKHGAPFFKFSVKSPKDVYVAKTWKLENSLIWVYTFHSLHRRQKSNASGWGLRNDNKESSPVGQMQVWDK